MISLSDFEKVEMRVGTIVDASSNKGARKPAYKLKIDFGDYGIKNSSAQITELYTPEDLIGKQVIAVMNFEPLRVSEIKSEVRILGAETTTGVILLSLDDKTPNGTLIS